MNERSRIKRLKRIHTIESKRLDSMTAELRLKNEEIDTRRREHQTQQRQMDQLWSSQSQSIQVTDLKQFETWSHHQNHLLSQLMGTIKDLETERRNLLVGIQKQRATVEGWARLIKKMESAWQATQQKQAMLEADERFLQSTLEIDGRTQ